MGGERRFQAELHLKDLPIGDFMYLRVLQEDGALAWASPWFLE